MMEANEDNKEQGAAGFAHDYALKLSGVGQWTGDTALLAYGAAKNDFKIGSVGALGYLAGFIGLRYGNPKLEKQLARVERNLGDYLREQHIDIPKDPTLAKLNEKA